MVRRGAVGVVIVCLAAALAVAVLRKELLSTGLARAVGSVTGQSPGPSADPSTPSVVATPPAASSPVSDLGMAPPAASVKNTPAPDSGAALSPDELFARSAPAVVLVEVRDSEMKPVGLGSGFFVSADGLLVTNFHVIASASFAGVRTARGGTMLVEGVAAADPDSDLALLKVGAQGVAFLKVGEGAAPPVGTRVFAIGNPQGLTNTLSEGLVSGARSIPNPRGGPELSVIQTTAAISHGSSGGALLDARGVVIGVTTAGVRDAQNLNFAVPADAVRRLIGAKGTLRPLASASGDTLSSADAAAYDAVLAALDHGRFEQAATLMKGLSEGQRNTPAYWITTGYLHYKLRNFDLAARAYREAVRLRPDCAAAYAGLGDLFNFQNKAGPAIEMYRKAMQFNPRDVRLYRGVGEILAKQGKFVDAIAVYDEGIILNPADPELLCRKAILQGASGRFADAEITYRVALKLDPQRVDTYIYLGETYLTWHKWEKAIATYQKALAIQPDNAMAYCQLGVACYNAKNPGDAEAAWRSAHRFDPYGQWGNNARKYLQNPKQVLIR
jgi:S1-C subfamily serine protease/cytochrome c-type biogenesis protein CcmH/NrfG